MKKTCILFDLDGTLTDPFLGITKSVQHALKHFGIVVEDLEGLRFFIGPPLRDSFMENYDLSEQQANEAIGVFREYFIPKGIYENEIYEGITELLGELKKSGKRLIVATSKPADLAREVLRYFDIGQYFEFVAGSTMQEERTKKEEVIAFAMEQCGLTDPAALVMVGDRRFDVEGARRFGIESVGVLYGHGSLKELDDAGADYIVESVSELRELLNRI